MNVRVNLVDKMEREGKHSGSMALAVVDIVAFYDAFFGDAR